MSNITRRIDRLEGQLPPSWVVTLRDMDINPTAVFEALVKRMMQDSELVSMDSIPPEKQSYWDDITLELIDNELYK